MTDFKNKKDGSNIHIRKIGDHYFISFRLKHKWLKHCKPVGPFDTEGDALLALAMSKEINFSDFKQVFQWEGK